MKKTFILACFLLACCIGGFVVYGLRLNMRSDGFLATVQSNARYNVAVFIAGKRRIRPEIGLPGIGLSTTNIADVVVKVEGTIRDLDASVGKTVKEGDILFRLDNPFIDMRLSRAKANLAKAERDRFYAANTVGRSTGLLAGKAISQSDFEAAESQLKVAEAELEVAHVLLVEAEQEREYQEVAAPMAGDILIIYQKEGAHIAAGAPVMLLADFSVMDSVFQLPEKDFVNLLPLEEEYELVVPINSDSKLFNTNYEETDQDGSSFAARIVGVSPGVGTRAMYRQVSMEILNPAKLLENGLYTDVVLRKKTPVEALAIPLDAVQGVSGPNPEVFVVDGEGRLEKRSVRLGADDGYFVEITGGLKEGDAVVESNVLDLRPGSAVLVQETRS